MGKFEKYLGNILIPEKNTMTGNTKNNGILDINPLMRFQCKNKSF